MIWKSGWTLVASLVLSAAASAMDGRLPGSVLVYPIHRSGPNFTIVSVTNTALQSQTQFSLGDGTGISWRYLNMVPGATSLVPHECTLVERIEYLTPGDTSAVLTACQNAAGDQEGFVVVSAQDPNYFKTDWSFNFLIGSEVVVNQANGMYMLNAIPFQSPQARGSHTDNGIPGFNGEGRGDGDGEIDFDGIEYEAVPDDLYADSFLAVAGSSLTLLNLSGGSFFKATVGLDIWNDNEHPMSATFQFRCWMEEELADLSPVFSQFHLYNNTPHDPLELDIDCDMVGDIETGWFRVRGLEYSSDVDSCLNPALLGAITAGPSGNINGGHLLWESHALQVNGDVYKFASDDPECPEPIPMPPFCEPGPTQVDLEIDEVYVFDGSASSDPDGVIVEFLWTFGDGGSANTAVAPHSYAMAGQYLAKLMVTDDDGLPSMCSVTVNVNEPPKCDAGPMQEGQLEDTFQFDGSGSFDPDGSIVQYDWDFGDGTTANDAGPMVSHQYTLADAYTVTLVITDDKGRSVECTTMVEVNDGPDCDAGVNLAGNDGTEFMFDATGSSDRDGAIEQYDWDFGDGTIALDAGPTPKHTYAGPGEYTVTLTVTDDSGSTSECGIMVAVNALPECDAGPAQMGVDGTTFTFDGSGSSDPDGTIAQYDWDFGDGTVEIDAGPMPMHTYAAAGDYTVLLTVTDDDGASSTCPTTVAVNDPPICDAGIDLAGNDGDTFDFDGSASFDGDGTIERYDWDFGDGNTAPDAGPTVSHTYASPGVYTVKLTITDDDGAVSMCGVTVTVNALPSCDAGGPYAANVNEAVQLDGSGSSDPDGTIVRYDWVFGDGDFAMDAGPMPMHTYGSAGSFTAMLTVTDDSGATSTCPATVIVNSGPSCDAGGPYAVVDGDMVQFDASGSSDPDGTIVRYDWDYGDGNVAMDAGPMPTHTYAGFGNYNVLLTVTDDDGASSTCPTTVLVNGVPLCDAGGPYTGEIGVPVQLDGTGSSDPDGSIVQYDWVWGDGTTPGTDVGPTPTHVYASAGTFTVTLRITDDFGTQVICQAMVTINAPPICDLALPSPPTANVGEVVTFDGSGSSDPDGTIVSYEWDFGDGNMGTGAVVMHSYTMPGNYVVTLTVTDDSGASESCSLVVPYAVNGFPNCNAGGPYMADLFDEVTFDGSGSMDPDGTIVSFDWDFGDGTVLPNGGPMPKHTYTTVGTFNVLLTVTDDDGASSTCPATVEITAVSGALVFSGDDSDQHCPATLCGAMGPKLIQWVLDNSPNQGHGILVVGMRETDLGATPPLFSQSRLTFDTWLGLLSPTLDPDPVNGDVRLIDDPAEFMDPAQTDFDDYRMIFVPSFEGHTPGGITQAMLDALLARKADLENYVMNRGGGLFVLTQATDSAFNRQVMNGLAWAPVPVTSSDDRFFEVCPSTVGLNGNSVFSAPLPGTDCSLVDPTGLSHEAWHNTFTPDPVDGFHGLEVFAVGNEAVVLGEAAVIGGIPVPPQFPAAGPVRNPLLDLTDPQSSGSVGNQ